MMPSSFSYTPRRLISTPQQMRIARKNVEASLAAQAFRDDVLAKVRRLTPKTIGVLTAEMEREWGDVCEQRMWRAVRQLMAEGRIVRTDEGYVRK